MKISNSPKLLSRWVNVPTFAAQSTVPATVIHTYMLTVMFVLTVHCIQWLQVNGKPALVAKVMQSAGLKVRVKDLHNMKAKMRHQGISFVRAA
jgi:hypothetical protein